MTQVNLSWHPIKHEIALGLSPQTLFSGLVSRQFGYFFHRMDALTLLPNHGNGGDKIK